MNLIRGSSFLTALREIVVTDDGLDVLPPFEVNRLTEFDIASSKKFADRSVEALNLALRLRVTRSSTSDIVTVAGRVIQNPIRKKNKIEIMRSFDIMTMKAKWKHSWKRTIETHHHCLWR